MKCRSAAFSLINDIKDYTIQDLSTISFHLNLFSSVFQAELLHII